MSKFDVHICEDVSDPDTFDWCCPTCRYYNPAPFVVGECARCGYEIDPDMFLAAHQARDRAAFYE